MKILSFFIILSSLHLCAKAQETDTLPPGQEEPFNYIRTRIFLENKWSVKLTFYTSLATDSANYRLDSINPNSKKIYHIQSECPVYLKILTREKTDIYKLSCQNRYNFNWDPFRKRWILTQPAKKPDQIRVSSDF